MKKIKIFLIAIFALSFLIYSCEKESVTEEATIFETDDIINNGSLENATLVTDESILNSIRFLDLDVGEVTNADFHLPDGTVERRIHIGSDIAITKTELEALYNYHSDSGRHYRTANLVTGANRTINILGYTGGRQALSSKARTALTRAVATYNSITNMALQFNLSFGTNYKSSDVHILVYDNSINKDVDDDGRGGKAGFPKSSGKPHKFIQIYNMEKYPTNANTHVIIHEIGHAVGFRHTDWFNRNCKRTPGSESSNNAYHITGTPTGRDLTSVMRACFNGNTASGAINVYDVSSLRSMYPVSSGSVCDGVSEWQSGVTYYEGSLVTYFGNLYKYTFNGWTLVGPC